MITVTVRPALRLRVHVIVTPTEDSMSQVPLLIMICVRWRSSGFSLDRLGSESLIRAGPGCGSRSGDGAAAGSLTSECRCGTFCRSCSSTPFCCLYFSILHCRGAVTRNERRCRSFVDDRTCCVPRARRPLQRGVGGMPVQVVHGQATNGVRECSHILTQAAKAD